MWEQTDELQFVKRVTENHFEVLETIRVPEGYVLCEIIVNIDEYSDQDLEREVKAYYNSFEEIKEMYKEDWKQILAEIIAENHASGGKFFTNTEKLKAHLLAEFKINL